MSVCRRRRVWLVAFMLGAGACDGQAGGPGLEPPGTGARGDGVGTIDDGASAPGAAKTKRTGTPAFFATAYATRSFPCWPVC